MTAFEEVEIRAPTRHRFEEILTPHALAFVARLHREFNGKREELLERRGERQAERDAGEMPDFLAETRRVREGQWRIPPVPADLADRRVEITGPTDRKMMINALNSGAKGFMADFEDANSPTWDNMIDGQINVMDAIEGTIQHSDDGKTYRLKEQTATLMIRPRGWHLPEKHIIIDGTPVAGALLDFGLFFFHNARRLLEKGTGPYVYLPKLESHLEARLWNDVFQLAQDELGLDRGTVKATVLIETLPAAFEMEEILFELRDHSAGLNAGRWDYMFSMIKCFRNNPDFLLPDRNDVTMTVPFMRAYTDLLVKTCHRRGAHAMGGMAAFIPSRKQPEVNEKAFEKVREDKKREASGGFDGTWIAHPDLVDVAKAEFDGILGSKPNQVDRQRDEVSIRASDLLDVKGIEASISEAGLRNNVVVGIKYISSWLAGRGAAAIYDLMEDTATAEIARSQVWQWVRHGAALEEGPEVTREAVQKVEQQEVDRMRDDVGGDLLSEQGRLEQSRALFDQVALAQEFVEFLTLQAYERLP